MIQILDAAFSFISALFLIYILKRSITLNTAPWLLRMGVAAMIMWLFHGAVHVLDFMQEPITIHVLSDAFGKFGILLMLVWVVRFHKTRALWDHRY